jgi:hypothetical protein
LNIEVEIIEQVADEPFGRSVAWLCNLMDSLGHRDPFVALHGMWRKGYLSFADAERKQLPPWRCEQILRDHVRDGQVTVLATERGLQWVYGPSA